MKVMVATPSASGRVASAWAQAWADLLLETQRIHQVGHMFVDRAMVDDARNTMLRRAVADDADYVLFLDDDTSMARDGANILVGLGLPIASPPVACRRGTDWINVFGRDGKPMAREEVKGTMRVGAIGMASTLVRRDVIDAMLRKYRHPFEFQVARDMEGNPVELSEDVSFCLRAEALGFATHAVSGIGTTHWGDPLPHRYGY